MELIYSEKNPSFPEIIINDFKTTPYWVSPLREWVDDVGYWLDRRLYYANNSGKQGCVYIIGEVRGFCENLSFYARQEYKRFPKYQKNNPLGYDNTYFKGCGRGWALYESDYLIEALEWCNIFEGEIKDNKVFLPDIDPLRINYTITQLRIYCYYQLGDLINLTKCINSLPFDNERYYHKHIVWRCLKYKLDGDKDSLIKFVEPIIRKEIDCSNTEECVVENYMALAYYYYMVYLT